MTDSIKDLSFEYKYLQEVLEGTNYNVVFDFKKFQFTEADSFFLNNLRELFPQEKYSRGYCFK